MLPENTLRTFPRFTGAAQMLTPPPHPQPHPRLPVVSPVSFKTTAGNTALWFPHSCQLPGRKQGMQCQGKLCFKAASTPLHISQEPKGPSCTGQPVFIGVFPHRLLSQLRDYV